MAEEIQFTIEGLTLRGFFETMEHWVPYSGERLNCVINTNGPISAFKGQQSVGNVQREWSKCYRKWINAGGKLEAIVCGLHKVHRNKSEEVPVIYLFSGNSKPELINIRNSIRAETKKKAKKKKSLRYIDGDKSEKVLKENNGSLVEMESLEKQTDKLDFYVSRMSLRGFFEYKKKWVPEIGSRHECFISNSGSIAIKIDGHVIIGNIPTDVQKLWKRFLKRKGKITAVVADRPRNHRTKGEEVPADYIFTGEMTCMLQNLRRSIIADIQKKKKKKKSLDVTMGIYKQVHFSDSEEDLTFSDEESNVSDKDSNGSDEESTVSAKHSTVSVKKPTAKTSASKDKGKRLANGKVTRKRSLQNSGNKVGTSKKIKKSSTGDRSQEENANNNNENASNSHQEIQRKNLREKLVGTGLDFRGVCKKALTSNTTYLKREMNANELQDQLATKELFDSEDQRDLWELTTTSKKNDFIFIKMVSKYVPQTKDNYHLFKECLDAIGQSHLVDKLEEKEDDIMKEKKHTAHDDPESHSE